MKSYSVTDVGQKRSENQDYVYASEQPIGNLPNLFVVADGMGGHNAGDFASRCAVSVLTESVKKNMSFNPIKIIRHGIESANEQVYLEAGIDVTKAGMGTTIVAVTIVGYYAYVANVGDSRLYLLNPTGIAQITKDHSYIGELVRRGRITKEEARYHPDKNIITRAVGTGDFVNIDFFDVELSDDTRILLCSDGLSNMVRDEEIHEIIYSAHDIEEAAKQLVEKANEYGGSDNISVIVIEPFTNEVKKC
ncbi:MAG: Stp1/IreP family PP2C-type Ser/Thr phosphatase [Ruminococcus sp.]|nr:Stp1/IreP family PP2C-type Ser/Thr phosphatase [Ruminococcus sp.]